ncbi:hypothetical protein GOODEAATRI_008901 [Goodea atripinnis]|uniref:Uncharacterized protein n=1 Tax=Goodea atripinnis TaxID=208336 RepID=A0ABV0PX10_9TELE
MKSLNPGFIRKTENRIVSNDCAVRNGCFLPAGEGAEMLRSASISSWKVINRSTISSDLYPMMTKIGVKIQRLLSDPCRFSEHLCSPYFCLYFPDSPAGRDPQQGQCGGSL